MNSATVVLTPEERESKANICAYLRGDAITAELPLKVYDHAT